MKQLPLALLALPLVGLTAPAEATTITLIPNVLNAPGDAVYQDFDSYAPGTYPELPMGLAILGGGPTVVDTVSGDNVLGTGEAGNHYIAVSGGTNLSLTYTGGPGYYLGFLWGTVDGFNSVTFFDGGQEIATFTGFDLQEEPDHTSAIYANFYATGGTFTSVVFSSSENSFEFDNIRVATTPLPAGLGLFGAAIAGLGVLGFGRRRPH